MKYDVEAEITLKINLSLQNLRVEDKAHDSFTGLLADSAKDYLNQNMVIGTQKWGDNTLYRTDVQSIRVDVKNWYRKD